MIAQCCSWLVEYTGIPFLSQILTVMALWSVRSVKQCPNNILWNFFPSKNQCKFFLFYLAVVAFSGHQGSGMTDFSDLSAKICKITALTTWLESSAASTIFWVGSKYVSRRFGLSDALIFSKIVDNLQGQVDVMSLVNSLLSGASISCSEGRKLP